jgi:hypothetical protein
VTRTQAATSILKAEAQLMRAAQFRTEAAVLRDRASDSPEPLIHDKYMELAERWTSFAANLEVEASYQLAQDAAGSGIETRRAKYM